jgi:hypothetical protein
MKRIKLNGLYAVLSYHFYDTETVFLPKYTKDINGNYIKNNQTVLVYRFPVQHKNNIVKLKARLYNENVIKIPECCISLLNGDVDGDSVCCIVLDEDLEWEDDRRENQKIENTKITFDITQSRCQSFIEALFDRDINKWNKLYSDAVIRQKLMEYVPKLPGSILKHLLSKELQYYKKENKIYYNDELVTKYHNKFDNCDIWILSVQEFMNVFYTNSLSLKHPDTIINLDELYSLYTIVTKKDVSYFENEINIKQNKKYDFNYFRKYFENDDFLIRCYDVIKHGLFI